jgi:hypothetical protein
MTCLLAISAQSQEVVTTASGKQITVFPDGTWKVLPDSPGSATSRSVGATAKLEVNRGRSAVYYDPNKWKLKSEEQGGRSNLEHAEGDGYALIIAERVGMSIDVLKNIALQNARAAAPDASIVAEEPRKVNGVELLMLQIEGTISGIPFTYLGYYYTGEHGSIQVITFTGRNLFAEFRPDFEELLNGFVVKP